MAERADSLLHRVNGYAADRIRRALGLSTAGRLGEVERDLEATRMTLARDLKGFRGMRSDDPLTQVTPDSSGFIRLFGKIGSGLSVAPSPNVSRHGLELDLDPAGLGCDCCPEDMTYAVVIQGTTCLQGAMTFNPATCTLTLTLDLDETCLCDRCDIVNPPG